VDIKHLPFPGDARAQTRASKAVIVSYFSPFDRAAGSSFLIQVKFLARDIAARGVELSHVSLPSPHAIISPRPRTAG
jgi:hypothetical protein